MHGRYAPGRFAQCKEGAQHKRVKLWPDRATGADPQFSAIDTEKRWKDADGICWRQPNVQGKWRGHRIAFEVQLSTTFLHLIAECMTPPLRQSIASMAYWSSCFQTRLRI